jgi:hypothetical protein
MTKDDREPLDVLKAELDFIEKGGYGRSVRTPWQPPSIFQDSRSCINFGERRMKHPCEDCLLMDFVPSEARDEDVPCHHIPLNANGETIDDLQRKDQQSTEEALKDWIVASISLLEKHGPNVNR